MQARAIPDFEPFPNLRGVTVLGAIRTTRGELRYAVETRQGSVVLWEPQQLFAPEKKRPPAQLDFWDS